MYDPRRFVLHALVAPVPPVDNQGGVFGSGVRPCEVPGVDYVGLAVGEAFVQVLAVHREDTGIVVSGDDLDRRLYGGEQCVQ